MELVVDSDPEPPIQLVEYAKTPDGLLITSDERKVVDGEEWFPVMGMDGDEWVRIVEGRTMGRPYVVQAWGEEYGLPRSYMPDDWEGPEEGKWVPCIPYTFRGYDFTEYDVDFEGEYDTFEEAVRVGKEAAKKYEKWD